MDNNSREMSSSIVDSQQIQLNSNVASKVFVQPSQVEFFYEKFKQCYPMYKNPRGQCLIVNIYQINGMPPRRWSDRDTDTLKQLFEQLLFNVTIYTDSTHDLNLPNFKNIIQNFSQMEEHEDAQCCIICLMSHGEEGFLTTKEGNKILLDDIFTMFNNVNCPSLAGKPKLFFIQSCRDDPITGPAEDLGIRLSFNLVDTCSEKDEKDGGRSTVDHQLSDNNNLMNQVDVVASEEEDEEKCLLKASNSSSLVYHIPTLCDMIIGFPTQKGFIAYRKPEIGSWYMNAIVQVFSKYAHNTDLCAMLNMVNSLISNEVTNTGKKQMSEFTSKLTKPYFYFFPGLASDQAEQVEFETEEVKERDKSLKKENQLKSERKLGMNRKKKNFDLDDLIEQKSFKRSFMGCDENYQVTLNSDDDNEEDDDEMQTRLSKRSFVLVANRDEYDENDSSNRALKESNAHNFIHELASSFCKSNIDWKHLARELDIGEQHIKQLDQTSSLNSSDKFKHVFSIWSDLNQLDFRRNRNHFIECILKLLNKFRMNRTKNELMANFVNLN